MIAFMLKQKKHSMENLMEERRELGLKDTYCFRGTVKRYYTYKCKKIL